jgi:hypothetical protein
MISLRLPLPILLACFALAGCTGCSSSSETSSAPPPGLTCQSTKSATDANAVRSLLAGSTSGACVVLSGTSFAGPFVVPAGVTLAASSRAVITGGSATEPAVSLDEGSALVGVDVTDAASVGVAVRGASATITDVNVTGAKSAALAVRCEGATCASGVVAVNNVTLTKSSLGLWVNGAHVVMKGGRSAEHGGQSLTAGQGVVAQSGAHLELTGVTVEKNEGVGLLVDGAQTTTNVDSSTIADNGERGVWIQRVAGTLDAPAVRINDSQLVRNKIVGLGLVESRGIIIVGGRVGDTAAAAVVTDLTTTEQVGDGIGIFGGSTDFKVDGSIVDQNARAAGLVDKGSNAGIIIVGGKIGAGASGLKFVVQNTPAGVVQVQDADKSAPTASLGVSAPTVGLPAL